MINKNSLVLAATSRPFVPATEVLAELRGALGQESDCEFVSARMDVMSDLHVLEIVSLIPHADSDDIQGAMDQVFDIAEAGQDYVYTHRASGATYDFCMESFGPASV